MMNRYLHNKALLAGCAVILLTAVGMSLLRDATADQSKTPAKAHHVNEEDFNKVHLNERSIKRLGIQTSLAKQEQIQGAKSFAAEVIVPLGQSAQMLAPVAGKLIVPNPEIFRAGAKVKPKQLLYQIHPILTADTQTALLNTLTDAKGAVTTAKTQLDAAKIRLERAQQLLKNLVGSQKNVDDATEQYQVAQSTLAAAKSRYQAITQSAQHGSRQRIDVRLPQGGEISNILAMPNQLVAAGTPIVGVAHLDTLWVKVPVPSSDIDQIDQEAPAVLQAMSASVSSSVKATPVDAPPSADPLTGATYRYYAIQNNDRSFNPAQRVILTLHTKQTTMNALTVPWSAVVFDIYGGSWVYRQTNEGAFVRQRVFVEHVLGDKAVLSQGPEDGAHVVSQGALELLGVETGVSH